MSDTSFSIANPDPPALNTGQRVGVLLGVLGFVIMMVYWMGFYEANAAWFLYPSLLLLLGGPVVFGMSSYLDVPPGIKNNQVYFYSLTSRGILGWALGVFLTSFYVILYWYPEWLGLVEGIDTPNKGLVGLFDPLAHIITGHPASQWFMYGTLYTVAILSMGIKFLWKYRHSKYHQLRTASVMFFQLVLAFMIPELMKRLSPSYGDANWFNLDLKNFWPLDHDFFYDWHLNNMFDAGWLGTLAFGMGLFGIFILTPTLSYFYGKRWYCSWVCGCGGLAETAGDPFRHLSDKSLNAWRVERWLVHSVLVFVIIMTGLVLYTFFSGESVVLGINSYTVREWYGFLIGAAFAGVAGVGFYPIMGSRVWCRFGCPMAAYIGLIQRFKSRFRITTNGGQCISCGNCSTYCEMGIDVRWYAQRGQDVVRASCVGCGVCASVCPRGVLRLENGPGTDERAEELRAVHIREDGVTVDS